MRPHVSSIARLIAVILICVWPAIAERLPVKIFTSADGLGSGFVDYVYRDSRGFMWFCTRDGLSRFDGSRFVTYRVGDTSFPPGIEAIFETKAGVYYVTTTGGTFRLRPDIVSDQRSQERMMTAEFLFGARGGMFEDSKGTIWMSYGPVSKLVEKDGKTVLERFDLGLPVNPARSLSVTEIAEGADGSLWLNSSWGLVRRLPDERIVFYPFEIPTGSGANSMIVTRDGRVWVTRGNKISVVSPSPADIYTSPERVISVPFTPDRKVVLEEGAQIPLPSSGQMFEYSTQGTDVFVENSYTKRLLQTSDGTVWVAAENILLEIASSGLRIHTSREGLPAVMGRMAEDPAGNLWIGGHAGLARIDRGGLITYGKDDGSPSSRFFAVTTEADGTPVFAGRDHTLNRFNGKGLEIARPSIPPDSLYLWTSRFAYRSSTGDWWILSNEKLFRFSGVSDSRKLDGMAPTAIYDSRHGLRSNGMFQIFEDSKKRIWVSTRGPTSSGHGVAVLLPGEETFRPLTESDGFPGGKSPASFIEDRRGRIWFAFYEGGLAIYDGTRVNIVPNEHGIPGSGHITDIHIDQSGRMWMATSVHGLYRVDNADTDSPTFSRVENTSMPLGSNLRTITEDRFGRLYLGSARGVDRYCPTTGHVKRFTVSEGLASDFVVDSMMDRNGDLWFVTNDGISKLTPLDDEDPPPPQVFIGSLRISDRLQSLSELGTTNYDAGELPNSDNNFQIEWFGLDMRAGEFVRYQYMLEGADQGWSEPTDHVTVTYANLRPAKYRFLVRAINTEGYVSSTPAAISFHISAPIWQRWWFIALAVVGIGLMVYGIYRYRTARLLEINAALEDARKAEERLRRSREERLIELERVRSRIATDLHDDIGASLTQIAILSEVAQTQGGNGTVITPLAKISEVSNELVGTMSDIVWSINPSKDHLSDLVQRMRRFASDILAPKDITVRFDLPEDGSAIVVDSNIRREIFLVFKEAVNNVARHSGARRVNVRLVIDDRQIEMEIRDDGSGFDTAPPSFEDAFSSSGYSGNGILSMRKRAAEMGGSIEINSSPGNGTTVRLRMPRELGFDDSIIPNRTAM